LNKTLSGLRPVSGVCIGYVEFSCCATAVLVWTVETTANDMRRKQLRRPLNVIVTALPFTIFNVRSKLDFILPYFW